VSRFCKTYKKWVNDCRVKRRLTRARIAQSASIDNSYVTMIARDGMIPSREVSAAIGQTLCNDPEEGMIRAGYVPDRYIPALLAMHHDNTDDKQVKEQANDF